MSADLLERWATEDSTLHSMSSVDGAAGVVAMLGSLATVVECNWGRFCGSIYCELSPVTCHISNFHGFFV